MVLTVEQARKIPEGYDIHICNTKGKFEPIGEALNLLNNNDSLIFKIVGVLEGWEI